MVTQKKLPLAEYTVDPKDFLYFNNPYIMTSRGADQRCPYPPNSPYRGADFFGEVTTTQESNILWKPLT